MKLLNVTENDKNVIVFSPKLYEDYTTQKNNFKQQHQDISKFGDFTFPCVFVTENNNETKYIGGYDELKKFLQ